MSININLPVNPKELSADNLSIFKSLRILASALDVLTLQVSGVTNTEDLTALLAAKQDVDKLVTSISDSQKGDTINYPSVGAVVNYVRATVQNLNFTGTYATQTDIDVLQASIDAINVTLTALDIRLTLVESMVSNYFVSNTNVGTVPKLVGGIFRPAGTYTPQAYIGCAVITDSATLVIADGGTTLDTIGGVAGSLAWHTGAGFTLAVDTYINFYLSGSGATTISQIEGVKL